MHEGLTTAELDDAYANGAWIEGAESFPPRWAAEAAAFRAMAAGQIGLAYGDQPRERIDLFKPAQTPKGLLVFVHGGYWVAFDRGDWSWIARGVVARGWAVACIGYPLAPEARLSQITTSVRKGIRVAAAQVPGPIVLTGHSAGGHLVARMANPTGPPDLWPRIRRIIPISPLSDLRPFLRQSLNESLRLDTPGAAAESPALHPNSWGGAVTIWLGQNERPAFLDQARALQSAWNCDLTIAPNRHHFDVIDDLATGPLLDHALSSLS